ncbi:hypothetical protein [Halobacteriaceae bacterium SHR40]|uniref:hypothetical protein n=1 Tax=Halovenus amylolytica TaxID=2500550 RepID=UPI000FE374F8
MSEGYILNTLQSPALLKPVYESVQNGNVTREEISENTGLDSNDIQEATGGLRLARLLGKEDGEYYTAEVPWEITDTELEFRIGILHGLAKECQPSDWGKQAVVLLNYQYFMVKDIQYFNRTDSVVYDTINEWHRSEKDYVPTSKNGEIDLNKHKMVNWSRIAEYLGLIHQARGAEYTVYPDPELLQTSISLALADRGSDNRVGIEAYLNWLESNLLPIELTADGDIPAPFARVLFNLVKQEEIELVEYGDAGAIQLARTPRADGIDPDANTIKVMNNE